jgi:hypothetical protein
MLVDLRLGPVRRKRFTEIAGQIVAGWKHLRNEAFAGRCNCTVSYSPGPACGSVLAPILALCLSRWPSQEVHDRRFQHTSGAHERATAQTMAAEWPPRALKLLP